VPEPPCFLDLLIISKFPSLTKVIVKQLDIGGNASFIFFFLVLVLTPLHEVFFLSLIIVTDLIIFLFLMVVLLLMIFFLLVQSLLQPAPQTLILFVIGQKGVT
jgi:hypothetical protein